MKLIKYQITIDFIDEGHKNISLKIAASSDKELFELVKKALDEKSKWSLKKLLKF